MLSGELDVGLIGLVALVAGVMRGFCGFGGPAFMLAILTINFTPDELVSKVFVVDLLASIYLFVTSFKDLPWRPAAQVTVPTLLLMPLGQWLLIEVDPMVMRQLIAVIIAICALVMLFGVRYKKELTPTALGVLGVAVGIVFGATYIALVLVAAMLLGPYDKHMVRGMLITWAFFAAMAYALISGISGTTQWHDYTVALPGAVLYLVGTWIGSFGFRASSETLFRNIALSLLLGLSLVSLIS